MNHEPEPTEHYVNLTRRDALMRALKGTVAAAVAAPVIVQAASEAPTRSPEPEFIPENDYPFFGAEVPPSLR